jgi:hypothetical protein
MRGNIHSYYTLFHARSQNPGSSVEMIERAIQAEWEQHKQQMDAMLAPQREVITTAITTTITAKVAAQMEAYVARIRVLEGSRHVSSESEVTNARASHDLESPAHVIIRSSIDSQ